MEIPLRYLALDDSCTIGEGESGSERWLVQLSYHLTKKGITF